MSDLKFVENIDFLWMRVVIILAQIQLMEFHNLNA